MPQPEATCRAAGGMRRFLFGPAAKTYQTTTPRQRQDMDVLPLSWCVMIKRGNSPNSKREREEYQSASRRAAMACPNATHWARVSSLSDCFISTGSPTASNLNFSLYCPSIDTALPAQQ